MTILQITPIKLIPCQRNIPSAWAPRCEGRNRRGFAAHTATQEQEYHPRPRSVSLDPPAAGA